MATWAKAAEEGSEKENRVGEAKSELSKLNGEINRMNKTELERRLKELQLDTEGKRDVLKKRLKTYYRDQKLRVLEEDMDNGRVAGNKLYDYYIVIDFEATCDANNRTSFMHEIIEFPAVLVSSAEQKIVGEFHRYCQPMVQPKLTTFCQELTGITQHRIDQAKSFPTVLQRFKEWLHERKIGTAYTFVVVTDGPWDMGRFLRLQCQISSMEYPSFAREWINIRKTFAHFYNGKRVSTMYPLRMMLQLLGLAFEGRPHCGLHDARNIGRIVVRLLKDGANLRANERIDLGRAGSAQTHCLPVLPISSEEFKRRIKGGGRSKPKALGRLEDEDVEPQEKGDDEKTEATEQKERPSR